MNAPPGKFESWLEQQNELLTDDAEGPHPSDARLAEVVERKIQLRSDELSHLARCGACREVVGALLEDQPEQPRSIGLGRVRRLVPLSFAAAAAVLVAVLIRTLTTQPQLRPQFQPRGKNGSLQEVSLTLLASDRAGRRVLKRKDRIELGGRLGFRYGNPKGKARTLSILAWDGARLHWFYPDSADGRPYVLEFGESAVNLRLPFDIVLDENFRAGRLQVAMGFDVAPKQVAERLKSGKLKGDKITIYDLKLQEAP